MSSSTSDPRPLAAPEIAVVRGGGGKLEPESEAAEDHPRFRGARQDPASAAIEDHVASLTEFESKVVALFVETAGVLGVPKSVAMIYGVLFGSAKPLTFAEIEQKLGISKGSVSQGLRALRELGAVQLADPAKVGFPRDVSDPGIETEPAGSGEAKIIPRLLVGRQLDESAGGRPQRQGTPLMATRYLPVVELRILLAQLLKDKLQPHLKSSSKQIDALTQTLERHPPGARSVLDVRMKHLRAWQRRLRQFLPVFNSLLK